MEWAQMLSSCLIDLHHPYNTKSCFIQLSFPYFSAFEFLGLPWRVRSSASKAWEGRFRPRCLARIMKCKTVATTCDQPKDYGMCKDIRGIECWTVWNHGSGKTVLLWGLFWWMDWASHVAYSWNDLKRTNWYSDIFCTLLSAMCWQGEWGVKTLTRTINRLHHQINFK